MKRLALVIVLLALALGCSKNPTAPKPPPSTASISVSPAAATVLVHGTLPLVATVSGSSDTAVTWRLAREPGLADTVDVGAIVSTGPRSASYTAPARVVTAGFDYLVTATAVSASDTTLRGQAEIVVPRVHLTVIPASLASVPPGTLVLHQVLVDNAPNPNFHLFVEGIAGGDAGVGTWVPTGAASALYAAPVHDTLFTYSLLVTSEEDPSRFATATVTVRPGFPVPTTDPSRSEYAPEWNPIDNRLAFVRGGPPWELVVYDSGAKTEQVLATLTWSGSTYDGRVAWSTDGTRLAFSEETGARRTLGLVNADGSGRASFAPDAGADYQAACFLPVVSPAAESLYVCQQVGLASSLRAYPALASAGEPGRLVYAPPAGMSLSGPDSFQPTSGRFLAAVEQSNSSGSDVLSIVDNGSLAASTAASGPGRRTQIRWASTSDSFLWITYVWGVTQNVYRVQRSGLSPPQRCYVDFFPESGADLKPDPPGAFHFVDAQAVARLEPSGHTRIWVIGFPPSSITPVSRAVEIELRRAGVWAALTPRDWRAMRVTP